jgi:Tfp pilus assembly protein PilE
MIKNREDGFTLLEIIAIVVFVIIGVIFLIPMFSHKVPDDSESIILSDITKAAKIVEFGVKDGSVTVNTTNIPPVEAPDIGAFSSYSKMVVKVVQNPVAGQKPLYCIRAQYKTLTRFWESTVGRPSLFPRDKTLCPTYIN